MGKKGKIVAPSAESFKLACEILRAGGLVAFPTETVYGLGANAKDRSAVAKIYQAKGRPSNNPVIVHVHSVAQFEEVADLSQMPEIKGRIERLSKFIPGPLSLVLPRSNEIPEIVSAGSDSIAVRVPNHPIALALLRECELPIAAPSANPSNYVSPTTAEHVLDSLGDKVDLIIDGGSCGVGIESTVLSLVQWPPVILRPGAVTREEIEEALGIDVQYGSDSEKDLRSPGQLLKHYSPHTPVVLIDRLPTALPEKVGVVAFSDTATNFRVTERIEISRSGNLEEVSKNLFAALRTLDRSNLDLIVVDTCPEIGLGVAIMDRVRRAAFDL